MTLPEASVEISLEDPRWADLGLTTLAPRAVTATLTALHLPPEAFEVSLLACDDRRIADLNDTFRGKPQATNVLSWPSEERGPATPGALPRLPDAGDPMQAELGDLALAYDTCMAEAADAGLTPEAHVTHLIVHGVLHLLGFDHIDDADADRMEALEVKILAKLGLTNPYDLSVIN